SDEEAEPHFVLDEVDHALHPALGVDRFAENLGCFRQEFNCGLCDGPHLAYHMANHLVGVVRVACWQLAYCDQPDHLISMALQLIDREATRERDFCVYVRVAGQAGDDQVVLVVRPTLASFDNVMDLELRGAKPPTDATPPTALDHHSVNCFGRDFAHVPLLIFGHHI